MAVNNHIHLIGRLGKDPVEGQTGKGNPKCTFSIAVDRIGAGKGEDKVTDWFFIVLYGKNAENALKILTKGCLVDIEGRVETYRKDDESTGFVVSGSEWMICDKPEGSRRDDGEASAPAEDDIPF